MSDIGLLCGLASWFFCLLCLYCAQQIKELLSSAWGMNGLPIQQRPAYSTGQLFACARACRGDVCLCSAACDTAGRGLSHLRYPCCLKQLCLLGCLEHLGVSWVTSVGPLQSPEIDIAISYILHIYMLSNYKYKINTCIFNEHWSLAEICWEIRIISLQDLSLHVGKR